MPSHTKKPAIPIRRITPNPIVERKRAAKAVKPLKAIFRGKFITSLGTFQNCGKTLGADDISNYVTAHGGTYERQVMRDTTHLICSIEEYKKGGPQVQAAWSLGKRKCAIVVFDWLLDCTVSKNKSCRATAGYTLDRTIKRIRQGKTDHRSFRNKFEEGVRASKELVDNRLYHVYYDQTGFEHKVLLTRINLAAYSGSPLIEKYTLYLFESNAYPHLYMTGAKLSRSSRPCSYYRENCHAMEFHTAFAHFRFFFQQKTGIDWDMRLERKVIPPKWAKEEWNHIGQRVLEEPIKFTYSPPVRGRPVGRLPLGYVRPEDRVVEEVEESGSRGESGESPSGSGTSGSEEGSTTGGSGVDVVYDTDSDVGSDEDEDEEVQEYVQRGREAAGCFDDVPLFAFMRKQSIEERMAKELVGGLERKFEFESDSEDGKGKENESEKGKGKEVEPEIIDLTSD